MKVKLMILFLILCTMMVPAHGFGEELVVFADAWSSEMNPSFEQAYPDVNVRNNFEETTHVSFDQVLIGLLTGENSYDMFFLRYSNGRAKTLSDHGYLVNLGQNELVRQTVSQMPESIHQHITTTDGRIFAFPCSLEPIDHLMGFNTNVGNLLGIQKPDTYADFFDIIMRWDSDYEAQAVEAGLYLVDGNEWTPGKFLARMINAYIASHPDITTISYDTPEFRLLMRLYDQYREMLYGLRGNIRVQSDGQPWEHALFITNVPLLMDFDTEESFSGVVVPMPLSITRNPDEAVIPVDMYVYSIADTAHLNLAMRYMEIRAAAFSPVDRILFQGGSDDSPVERFNYAETLEYYHTVISDLEARIETEGESQELLAELEQKRLELDDCIYRRYEYTTNSIRIYASLVGCLRPMPSISYEYYTNQPNAKYLLDSFEQGKITVDQFVRNFDNLQMMMNLEAEY